MTAATLEDTAQARPASQRQALGALINVAGRQRMLSHRAVMFLSLSRMAPAQARDGLIGSAQQALDGFEAGTRLLTLGDPESGIPALFSRRVGGLLTDIRADAGVSGRSVLDRFISRGRACIE